MPSLDNFKRYLKRMYSINSLFIKPSLPREMENIEDFDFFLLLHCRELYQTNRYEIVNPEGPLVPPKGKFDRLSCSHLLYPCSTPSIWYFETVLFRMPFKRNFSTGSSQFETAQ
jgi:hypothetical protein